MKICILISVRENIARLTINPVNNEPTIKKVVWFMILRSNPEYYISVKIYSNHSIQSILTSCKFPK